MVIRGWIERQFGDQQPKTFFECGSNIGQDTRWLCQVPGVELHCWEPDPRIAPPPMPRNVTWNREAIGATKGVAPFILSETRKGKPCTCSSSLKQPTGHLTAMPYIKFGDWIEVRCTTLDAYAKAAGIEHVALIWADLQGAEPDMIRGAQRILANTDWLYCECPEQEEYEGQLPVEGLLALLPGEWRVAYRWPSDVLFERL